MACLHLNARVPRMQTVEIVGRGAPDPIKIGWLGSALDGRRRLQQDPPDGLRRGARGRLADRPVEFVLHAENGLPRAQLAIQRMGSSTWSTKVALASLVPTAPTTRLSPPRWRTSSKSHSSAGQALSASPATIAFDGRNMRRGNARSAPHGLLATGTHGSQYSAKYRPTAEEYFRLSPRVS